MSWIFIFGHGKVLETTFWKRVVTLVVQHALSVAAPSVWNSLADYPRDPALKLNSFRRQLKTFLFAHSVAT